MQISGRVQRESAGCLRDETIRCISRDGDTVIQPGYIKSDRQLHLNDASKARIEH